jgi:hypothetical protein
MKKFKRFRTLEEIKQKAKELGWKYYEKNKQNL